MHKAKLIFALLFFSLGVMGQELGIIPSDTNKAAPSGLARIASKGGRTFIKDRTGKAEMIRSNNVYTNPNWLSIDKSKVGLSNVDNTSDINKPLSNAAISVLTTKLDEETTEPLSFVSSTDQYGGKTKIEIKNIGTGSANSFLSLQKWYYDINLGWYPSDNIATVKNSYWGFAGNSNPQAHIDLGTSGTIRIGNLAGTGKFFKSVNDNGDGNWSNIQISDVASLSSTLDGKQAQLNGLGYLKFNGTTPEFDNNTYMPWNTVIDFLNQRIHKDSLTISASNGVLSLNGINGGSMVNFNSQLLSLANGGTVSGNIYLNSAKLSGIDASGTNVQGGNIEYSAGRGTGSATGGTHIWYSSLGSITGSTLRSYAEIMRLTSQGRLGINNSNPSTELDLGGSMRMTGTFILPNYSTGYLYRNSAGNVISNATIPQSDVTGLSTTLAGYLPLSGGTLSVTSGSGFVGFPAQSSNPSAPTSGFRLFANSSGLFSWVGTNGFRRSFNATSISADRDWTLQDASGTLAQLNTNQTFLGTNIFSGNTYLATSSGNVGIGTTFPFEKFHLNNGRMYIQNNDARLRFYNNGAIAEWEIGQKSITSHGFTIGKLVSGVSSDFINITTEGNVGIGTINPTSKLHNSGSQSNTITTISTATTLGEHYYIIASGSSTYLVTLPAASTCVGRTYCIKTTTANKTISSFINQSGSSTTTLTAGTVIYIVSDGTNWQQF